MNEKKKLLVLGALGVVVLTVGVFQLRGGPQPEATPPAKKPQASATPANPETVPPAVEATKPGEVLSPESSGDATLVAANALPKRDPFDNGRLSKPTLAPQPTKPVATQAAPVRPPTYQGSVTGSLPSTGGMMPVSIAPGEKLPSPEDFTYTLAGVIEGERSAAVFADANGNQRLIVLGGSLEPNSKLVSVKAGKAVVRHYGKTITLAVGETPK